MLNYELKACVNLDISAFRETFKIILDKCVSFFIVNDFLVQVFVDLIEGFNAENLNNMEAHLCSYRFSDETDFLAFDCFKEFRSLRQLVMIR